MTIANDMLIANIPALKLRDFLKRYAKNGCIFGMDAAIFRLALSPKQAKETLQMLLKEGYIQKEDILSKNAGYSLTIKGNSLAMAKATKRIKREKVDQLINDILTRADYANDSENIFLYKVKKIYLFGSCTDKTRADYGDIDIAVELEKKLAQSEDCIKEEYRRFAPIDLSWKFNEEDKLYRFLKARSSYINIHSAEDMNSIEAKSIEIFSEVQQNLKTDDNAIINGLNAIKKKKRQKLSEVPDAIYVSLHKKDNMVLMFFYFNDKLLGESEYMIINNTFELVEMSLDSYIMTQIIEKFGEKIFFNKLRIATRKLPKDTKGDLMGLVTDVIADNYFDETKDAIKNTLKKHAGVPIIFVVARESVAELREEFKEELNNLAKKGNKINLFRRGAASGVQVFDIVSPKEYNKLDQILKDNSLMEVLTKQGN